MPRTAAAIVLAIATLTPAEASAQVSVPGPYIIDFRGAMTGAPGGASFYPPVTTSVRVPQRAFGFEAGAHVYAFHVGLARLGLGLDVMRARGSAKTDASASVSSSSSASTTVEPSGTISAAMTVTTFAPQLSFNFGTRDGWSYLSGGYGLTATTAELNVPASAGGAGTSSRERRTYAANFGGGARWFLREHLAVGFDVRFHRLRATHGLPSKQLVGLSVGMSLR